MNARHAAIGAAELESALVAEYEAAHAGYAADATARERFVTARDALITARAERTVAQLRAAHDALVAGEGAR